MCWSIRVQLWAKNFSRRSFFLLGLQYWNIDFPGDKNFAPGVSNWGSNQNSTGTLGALDTCIRSWNFSHIKGALLTCPRLRESTKSLLPKKWRNKVDVFTKLTPFGGSSTKRTRSRQSPILKFKHRTEGLFFIQQMGTFSFNAIRIFDLKNLPWLYEVERWVNLSPAVLNLNGCFVHGLFFSVQFPSFV